MPRTTSRPYRIAKGLTPKRFCVIATEDSKGGGTAYFEALRENLDESYEYRIKEVIPSQKGKSAPKHVLDNIEWSQYNPRIDSCWIVCDVDRWGEDNIKTIIKECKKLKISHAFSSPCFEIWILYHLSKAPKKKFANSTECKESGLAFLKKVGGYKKLLSPTRINHAINHAKNINKSQKNPPWPKENGSHVFKLITMLQK